MLLSRVVKHSFLDDYLQFGELLFREVETLHDILFVVLRGVLRAYHGIHPWHLLASRESFFGG